jgi:uncharacterized membrane protein SpoIIM required for sporulation
MIVDLQRFVLLEEPYWKELDVLLGRLENDPSARLSLDEAQRFHYLYERGTSALARMETAGAGSDSRRYLESVVARAYAEMQETRGSHNRLRPFDWFFRTFPNVFRSHLQAFSLSVGLTLAGVVFGCLAMAIDGDAKRVIMPFAHLNDDPRKRVFQEEEMGRSKKLEGHKASFSAQLMTNNTRVALTTLAFGVTWGVGTAIVLFYNGVTLGAVCWDYVMAGQGRFLAGWLLPHGSVEIPAIVLAGQAGLIFAGALIGWGSRKSRAMRLREVSGDVMTLIGGVAVLLIWAGVIEAFFSQYHAPVLPYEWKILFGCLEVILLVLFLARSGASPRA